MRYNNDFEFISSKDNERVKLFSKLSSSKHRDVNKLFLAEGVKLSHEAVSAGLARYVLIREEELEKEDIYDFALNAKRNAEVVVLSAPAFGKITTESAPQGVISVVGFPNFHVFSHEARIDVTSDESCIAIDSVRDPGNLGTILRSALAFGVDTVIIGGCADIYNTKTVRASMGALFHQKIIICDSLSLSLYELGKTRRILGAALKDDCFTLGKYAKLADDIIVIGNEGTGITREVAQACSGFVKIPMGKLSESLNAAVAASVFMWEYSKGRI